MAIIKKICIKVMLFAIIFTSIISVNIASVSAEEDTLSLNAEAAILIDADTGQVLYEKNADEMLGVASMSKMMTEYLVLEAINKNKISWDQEVLIDKYVHDLSGAPNLSNVGLTDGETYTVKELFEAMAVYSGNGATVALAQLLGSSEANYIKLMNKKAKELGLKDYYFVNSSGLNNEDLLGQIPAGGPTDENLMSARSTALLAYSLLKDFPEILKTTSIEKLQFKDGRTYPNFNWMLPGLTFGYNGVDGLKTGSTDFAGSCCTITAKKNGQRVISIVMKCKSKEARFQETQKVLNYAFSNFSKKQVSKANSIIKSKKTVPVLKGKTDKVKIAAKSKIDIIVGKNNSEKYQLKFVPDKKKFDKKGNLTAPVKKGEKVGTAILVDSQGKKISFIDEKGLSTTQTVVVTTQKVEKANIFVLFFRSIKEKF
ncbi:MAG: serine-type D-Ala-D-Ala carboxypeptidase [Bacillales bacterium]|jgi:D-alanyl-D-alanine carboxypeptidase (penicillin-binding protein 5/6)|nr:serine-type D-Ala-D-Ala carboxypeptidase [Bacillales bacterium]